MSDDALAASVARLQAREAIRELAYAYAAAIEARDVDAMAGLFMPDARFGAYGSGPDGVRALMADSLKASLFAVILVANHRIWLDSAEAAHGEVWAFCVAQNAGERFLEQLIKYEDRYALHEGEWRFQHRRHRLWYGLEHGTSPLEQAAADWPQRQVGVGDLPLADARFHDWWRGRRSAAGEDGSG